MSLERLLCDIHQLLFDEHLRPVTLAKAIVLLRPLAEVLVFGKVVHNVLAGPNLSLHDVVLVEEHDQSGGGEETILPHGSEQLQSLLQTILAGILAQILIELAARDQEQYGLYAFEYLNPLIPLIPLATHVVHLELLFATTHALGNGYAEGDLRDAGGDLTAVQNVLGAGYVFSIADPHKVVQEAGVKKNSNFSKVFFLNKWERKLILNQSN